MFDSMLCLGEALLCCSFIPFKLSLYVYAYILGSFLSSCFHMDCSEVFVLGILFHDPSYILPPPLPALFNPSYPIIPPAPFIHLCSIPFPLKFPIPWPLTSFLAHESIPVKYLYLNIQTQHVYKKKLASLPS